MQISRGIIVELLHERGEGHRAADAERLLPDEVDSDRDAQALSEVGLDAQAIEGYLADRNQDTDLL